ncbi:MAG: type I glyceraldehyde-3-phosphate dehydrogenase [Chlamydiae bacterium]|nr:type I glyceraldehyde-3-phosphate dehydrogenase [Chlamydiota bacterium]
MKFKVAINGFGRIGRALFKMLLDSPTLEIVAVNDLVPIECLAYLLKYDSVHGRFGKEFKIENNELVIGSHRVKFLAEKDPMKSPWKELNVDFVVESTGLFTHEEEAKKHLSAGAKKVIISAPAYGNIPCLVMGVNHKKYDPSAHHIVSNASCTTNCLAPITKILLEHFGIEEGLMTTVHATTATQPTVDGPSKKDLRGGRSAMLNIIPATTGAAKAVALCLPEIEGKLTGMAFRVPVADVSVVDLTVKLTKSTTYDKICEVIKNESMSGMKGIVGYTEEPVVSSDFIGTTYSAIFDRYAGIGLNDRFFKLIAWYDNEVGYTHRILDLLTYMASRQ